MAFLKGLALSLLSILLFFLLTGLGIAITVRQAALSPAFVTSVVNSIDFAQTARDVLSQQADQPTGPEAEAMNAALDSLEKIQPLLKEKINLAITDAYAYVLGKANAPDLKQTLGETVMNAQFVKSVLDDIDISLVAREMFKEQTAGADAASQALSDSLLATIDAAQPAIKQGIVAACDPIFSYVLGKTPSINLKQVLRQDVLTRDFMTTVINSLDFQTITKDASDSLDLQLPEGITLTPAEKDQLVAAMVPTVKTALIDSADQMADFIAGIRPSFNVRVSLTSAYEAARPIFKEAFLRDLPPELAGASPAQIDHSFDIFWTQAQATMPATLDIGSSTFGMGVAESLDEALLSAQDGLTSARDSIDKATAKLAEQIDQIREPLRVFQTAFWGLVLVTVLVIVGVVAIQRSVRGASRTLGITFVAYGAIEFIGVFITRMVVKPDFIQGMVASGEGEIPASVLPVIHTIVLKFTQPLFVFTLVCALLGIGLIVLSIVYPQRRETVPAQPTDTQP